VWAPGIRARVVVSDRLVPGGVPIGTSFSWFTESLRHCRDANLPALPAASLALTKAVWPPCRIPLIPAFVNRLEHVEVSTVTDIGKRQADMVRGRLLMPDAALGVVRVLVSGRRRQPRRDASGRPLQAVGPRRGWVAVVVAALDGSGREVRAAAPSGCRVRLVERPEGEVRRRTWPCRASVAVWRLPGGRWDAELSGRRFPGLDRGPAVFRRRRRVVLRRRRRRGSRGVENHGW
jgi:hypothetical protein